jgi:hypothetical protein
MPYRYRSALWISGSLASLAVIIWLGRATPATRPADAFLGPAAYADAPIPSRSALALTEHDLLELTRRGRERYAREIRDYRCTFLKQERIDGKLKPREEIEVRYRESPTSIYMIWQKNASEAKRALFKDTKEFVDKSNQKVARVEPNGAIARLFVKDVRVPIDGPEAHRTSRRTIDEFGFKSTFELLERYNRVGEKNGVLDIRYGGEGTIDGRPTYVLIRSLPYDGPEGTYPDARMVLHLDQEWLLPTAVYSYADHEGKDLLGSYVFTKVRLNPGLTDDAFKF